MTLRRWAQNSGWLETDPTKLQVSPEDDATSFGQQVPILLTFLTVFTAAQTVNELWDKRRVLMISHQGNLVLDLQLPTRQVFFINTYGKPKAILCSPHSQRQIKHTWRAQSGRAVP
ncbi:hypothetical protein FJTKL_11074 [Diaporthe vaccinii]|uniref:Uncharacterized protein n=1 Tax=Diaporthe vaccinii TaxID=105482 RepID=A0ABR4EIM1_9PEZI